MKTINLLKTVAFSLALAFTASACSSTLAPEDDTTTEYVFEASSDDALAKADKKRNSDIDSED